MPTEAQIDEILRPIRPEALRTYAYNTGTELGLWLRLCYTNEEAHKSLWSDNEDAEWVTYEGVVLDDESIFGGLDLAAALEIFLECVTNERVNLELREKRLRNAVAAEQEGPNSGEEDYSDEIKEHLARQRAELEENPLSRYGLYQAECVVTHIYVEDEVAVNGGGLLHVFLDDCGNAVRQLRVHNDEKEDNYDGAWFELFGKRPLHLILEKLALLIMRVEAEGPHTLFGVLGLLGSTCR